jgi:hypothetical protein
VSDFGFGSRKEASLQLVESFAPTYWLKQMRVAGDDLRVLHAHPNKWQVRCCGCQHWLPLLDISLVNRYAWVVPVHEKCAGLQLRGAQIRISI